MADHGKAGRPRSIGQGTHWKLAAQHSLIRAKSSYLRVDPSNPERNSSTAMRDTSSPESPSLSPERRTALRHRLARSWPALPLKTMAAVCVVAAFGILAYTRYQLSVFRDRLRREVVAHGDLERKLVITQRDLELERDKGVRQSKALGALRRILDKYKVLTLGDLEAKLATLEEAERGTPTLGSHEVIRQIENPLDSAQKEADQLMENLRALNQRVKKYLAGQANLPHTAAPPWEPKAARNSAGRQSRSRVKSESRVKRGSLLDLGAICASWAITPMR